MAPTSTGTAVPRAGRGKLPVLRWNRRRIGRRSRCRPLGRRRRWSAPSEAAARSRGDGEVAVEAGLADDLDHLAAWRSARSGTASRVGGDLVEHVDQVGAGADFGGHAADVVEDVVGHSPDRADQVGGDPWPAARRRPRPPAPPTSSPLPPQPAAATSATATSVRQRARPWRRDRPVARGAGRRDAFAGALRGEGCERDATAPGWDQRRPASLPGRRRNAGGSPNRATAWRSGTRSRRCLRSASAAACSAAGGRRRARPAGARSRPRAPSPDGSPRGSSPRRPGRRCGAAARCRRRCSAGCRPACGPG